MVKDKVIMGNSVFYFCTPDTISSFLLSPELAPMIEQPPNYLHTVIIDIRDNANWPLKTEVRGVTTSLPTNPAEWEARIQRFAPDPPGNNTLARFFARSDKEVMKADWGRASRQLLTNFGVKTLIVRGNRGFLAALAADGPIVRNSVEPWGCVENVTELGPWPVRAQGALTSGMTLAEPVMANSKAFQTQARSHVCPGCLSRKRFLTVTSTQLTKNGPTCPKCQTPTRIIVQSILPAEKHDARLGNQHI